MQVLALMNGKLVSDATDLIKSETLASVADAPFSADHAEDAIRGAHPSDEMFREAGMAAARQARPAEDRRGPVDYKLAMVREMTERALRVASARATANA